MSRLPIVDNVLQVVIEINSMFLIFLACLRRLLSTT